MGEKKNGKEQGEKNNKDNVEKKYTPVVLKIEMHCDGCAKKIIKSIRRFEGVEDVHADSSSSKVTVFGKVDPLKLREKVETKTKKKVELISPLPNKEKDSKATDKKPEEKPEKKKETQTQVTTVILKTKLHCEGCIEKIYKSVMKIKGVESVTIDKLKELVTVKGTMDVKELPSQLKKKHNRSVEIVAPKKEDKKEGGDKKEKDSGGEKKQVEEAKADLANKMNYYGAGVYGYGYGNGYGYPQGGAGHGYGYGYAYPPPPPQGGGLGYGYGYPPPPLPPQGGGYVANNVHPPQMFSDENPNACSIM